MTGEISFAITLATERMAFIFLPLLLTQLIILSITTNVRDEIRALKKVIYPCKHPKSETGIIFIVGFRSRE